MLSPYHKLLQLIIYETLGTAPATEEEIDEAYDELDDDARTEGKDNLVWGTALETGLSNPCPGWRFSRDYDDEEVAVQALDGTWVGFTRWSGGGKHGCPGDIDWMQHLYEVDAVQVMEPVWKFKQKEKNEQS